jgi:outer membrane protein assembly factor BamB
VGVAFTSYAYPVTDGAPRGVAYDVGVHPVPDVPNVPPVLVGDDLYVLTSGKVLLRSGPLGGPAGSAGDGVAPLTVIEGTTVGVAAADGVVVTPDGARTVAVDGVTGEQLWTLDTGDSFIGSSPALVEGTAVVPIREVGLVAADARTGEPSWVAPVDGAAGTSTPLALPGGGVAYAGSGLTRYDVATGEVVWQLDGDLADAVAFGPVGTDGDAVYAVLVDAERRARPPGRRRRRHGPGAVATRPGHEPVPDRTGRR